MGNKALAVKVSDLGIPEYFSGIFTEKDFYNKTADDETPASIFLTPVHLLDRPACETDETYLQWIPYSSLRCREDGEVFIYAYQRAKLSGEQRLAGKWSIGLGGHVEELPGGAKSLLDVLAESCVRELEEEVGFKLSIPRAHALVGNSIFIRDLDTPTNRVHLGLSHVIECPYRISLVSQEDRVIANEGWLNRKAIVQMVADDLFEPWSAMLITGDHV